VGGIEHFYGGVNMSEAQIYIKKHKENLKSRYWCRLSIGGGGDPLWVGLKISLKIFQN